MIIKQLDKFNEVCDKGLNFIAQQIIIPGFILWGIVSLIIVIGIWLDVLTIQIIE